MLEWKQSRYLIFCVEEFLEQSSDYERNLITHNTIFGGGKDNVLIFTLSTNHMKNWGEEGGRDLPQCVNMAIGGGGVGSFMLLSITSGIGANPKLNAERSSSGVFS